VQDIITKIMKQRTLEDELYYIGLIFLMLTGVGGFLLWVFLPAVKIPQPACFFWKYLGIYCPGCGGTRSLVAFLHGQFVESLWYHPLIMYGVTMYLSFMVSQTLARLHLFGVKGMKFRSGYLYAALILIIVNFILKNVLKFYFGILML